MIEAAGLLVFRRRGGTVEVLLAHPGGPFWARKDEWSIPKGEVEAGETHLQAMEREFIEEMGVRPPLESLIDLGHYAAPAHRRTNYIWAAESDIDLADVHCDSMVTLEWPRGSGKQITFPENDRSEWFGLDAARTKIFKSQTVFLDRLAEHLGHGGQNSALYGSSI